MMKVNHEDINDQRWLFPVRKTDQRTLPLTYFEHAHYATFAKRLVQISWPLHNRIRELGALVKF